MTSYELKWSHGVATVLTTAAMLADVTFTLGDRRVMPFARASWIADEVSADAAGHVRVLGAEFVCVPFGSASVPADLDERWAAAYEPSAPYPPHGLSADAEWGLVNVDTSGIVLELLYPAESPIRRLERRILPRDGEPAIDMELRIETRERVRAPVGVHPILRLPGRPGALQLGIDFEKGYTYPGTVWPGAMSTAPAGTFDDLARVPAPEGGSTDFTRLPLGVPVEDVVQLCGVRAPVLAGYLDEGFTLAISWDTSQLPSVMIWHSDRALQEAPWSGRYRGLGVEMIAGAFDLPLIPGGPPTPIADDGYATEVDLDTGDPFVIRYSFLILTQ